MSAHDELPAACNALDEVQSGYEGRLMAAAKAEALYKAERGKFVVRARADGARSMAEAETQADADERLADLLLDRLTSAALVEASKQSALSLRTKISALQSYMRNDFEADRTYSQRRDVA